MKLIADSGSTKTDWRLIDEFNNIHQAQSIGLNPYFTSESEIIEALTTGPLKLFAPDEIEEVHFYGAGCSSEGPIKIMEDAMSKVYKTADLYIEHDLLGAARALCGKKKGIAGILGTGSNSCFFDGEFIAKNVPSLGYILGDEGSGAHMGRKFLADLLNDVVPKEMKDRFDAKFKLNREKILENVYMQPFPNRFLASFCRFLYQCLDLDYTRHLVSDSFSAFIDKQISQYDGYQELPLNLVGSIAFNFSAILRDLAAEREIEIGQILQAPIAALTLFHFNEQS